MLIKRRDFLKVGSLAATSLMIPNFMKALELPQSIAGNEKIIGGFTIKRWKRWTKHHYSYPK